MGSVRVHARGTLFLDFRHQGRRCREYTALPDSAVNRQRLQKTLLRIEQQIKEGTFDYAATFPASANLMAPAQLTSSAAAVAANRCAGLHVIDTPLFRVFIEQWIIEHSVEWRRSHLRTLRSTVNGHLLPRFGDVPVGGITREDVLSFRTQLAALPGRKPDSRLSPSASTPSWRSCGRSSTRQQNVTASPPRSRHSSRSRCAARMCGPSAWLKSSCCFRPCALTTGTT